MTRLHDASAFFRNADPSLPGRFTPSMSATQSLSDTASLDGAPGAEVGPFLTVLISCDEPAAPPLRVSLEEAGRVLVQRASRRRHEVTPAGVRLELPDRGLSESHFELRRARGSWTIADAGSKNGTFVNGARVDLATLEDDAIIEASRTFFHFRARVRGLAQAAPVIDAGGFAGEPQGTFSFQPALALAHERLARVAPASVAVLVHGETGTGKELTARGVHDRSRRAGPFVAVNCGAIPAALIESELFGHKKGAFSGALEDRVGLVRAAHRGTFFLDEVAELPEASQTALLRVLQEREVLPVGETRPIGVDARVVAATNTDLLELVERGRFRRDLYARLSAFTLTLPPLRERLEDLGILLAAFLEETAGPRPRLSRGAARQLLTYDWPMNVRELRNVITSASLLAAGGEIRPEHLPEPVRAGPRGPGGVASRGERRRLELVALLRKHERNVSAVARVLKTSRTQVTRLIERYAIDLSALDHRPADRGRPPPRP